MINVQKMESVEKSKNEWHDSILLKFIPPFIAFCIKLLLSSCRVIRIEGKEKEQETLARSGGRAIYCSWHQRLSYLVRYLRSRNVTAMVSQSRDGDYVAEVMRRFDIKTIRGSSTRGAQRALVAIIRRLKSGESAGMVADGPLGPAREAKIGSIIMAYKTGIPIIPLSWSADRCWVINSWDRFMIPKPFARVVVCCGEPIWIPSDTDGDQLEEYRKLYEDRLNECTRWCDEQFGPERPWRKVKEEGMPEIGHLEEN